MRWVAGREIGGVTEKRQSGRQKPPHPSPLPAEPGRGDKTKSTSKSKSKNEKTNPCESAK